MDNRLMHIPPIMINKITPSKDINYWWKSVVNFSLHLMYHVFQPSNERTVSWVLSHILFVDHLQKSFPLTKIRGLLFPLFLAPSGYFKPFS